MTSFLATVAFIFAGLLLGEVLAAIFVKEKKENETRSDKKKNRG